MLWRDVYIQILSGSSKFLHFFFFYIGRAFADVASLMFFLIIISGRCLPLEHSGHPGWELTVL